MRLLLCLSFVLFSNSVQTAEQRQTTEQLQTAKQPQTVKQLPAKYFAALPEFSRPALSPKGNRVAFINNIAEPKHLALLMTYDLDNGKNYLLLKSDNEDTKLNWFRWANNDTIIISAKFGSKDRGTRYYQTRLLSVRFDSNGEKPQQLMKPRQVGSNFRSKDFTSQFQDNVIDYLPSDPDHIIAAADFDIQSLPSVYKVNVNSGRAVRIIKGKRQIRSWVTDRQGRVRIGKAYDYKNGDTVIYERKDDDTNLRKIFEYNAMTENGIAILGFDLDPNILYYRTYEGDKLALLSLDLTSMKKTLVFADENYDVDGSLVYSSKTNDVIGVNHAHADHGVHYFKNGHTAFHKGLDKVMPETNNYITSFSEDENRYILYAENDNIPGVYMFGDRKEKSLYPLFGTYPQLPPESIADNKKVSYTTRDGVEIEGYLTLPLQGEAPYSMVIHPHGGPGARDYSGFDYWTAFMAHRGYAVFRPNFRGSSGYGKEFSEAQMKRWGLEMQDDISDAATWLIKEGIANKDKMCIVGASYGGYAATMATVKTPDLFSCAVSFAGVTHLPKLAYRESQFLGGSLVAENQIGDDSSDMKARSPYYNAEKVKTPTLLVHGYEDRVVHVEQSRVYAEELEDLGKPVKYVELETGDHYLTTGPDRQRFFDELDAFLATYLK
ncbi:MAG: dipeptidyl aminopeptidase/acylaminoacyl peptidase [Glaciecola sp.]|jgi:dipeptidyl aminopeptidase/acylaminoacyl peptidase